MCPINPSSIDGWVTIGHWHVGQTIAKIVTSYFLDIKCCNLMGKMVMVESE